MDEIDINEGYEAAPETYSEHVEEAEKSDGAELNEIAQQVLAGQWGRGKNRTRRLKDAGYDPYEVHMEIFRITGAK